MPTLASIGFANAKMLPDRAVLKLALAFLLPTLLLLATLAYSLLKTDVNVRRDKLLAQETGEVNVAERTLTHDFDSAISDLKFLARAPSLKHFINRGSLSEKQRVTDHFQNLILTKLRYDQIRFLDIKGMEKIRVNQLDGQAVVVPEKELQNKADRYFFHATLKLGSGEVYVSPLDLNIEHGKIEIPYKPVIRFGMPVFNSAGRKQGILLINFNGQVLLDNFARAMKEQQHAMLLNQDGYWLSNPDTTLEWAHMFGRNESFGKSHPAAWAKISTMQQGSFLMPDGLHTFATVYPLSVEQYAHRQGNNTIALHARDDYFWKVVSLVPAGEVPAISYSQYPRSFALFAIGMALLALLSVFFASALYNRRQLRATIFENEAHLKEITATLGEGVFVVDQQGLTTFVNPEAERLLGLSQAELVGKNAHDMIHYRNLDGTAIHDGECDIYQIMKSGKSFRSNSQVFWRKDGSFIHVDVSASPIVRDGNVMGAVVAFSDISKQKQGEAALLNSEAQLKHAQRLTQMGSWELSLATKELLWSDEIYRIFEITPSVFGASYEAFLNIIHPQDRERVNLAYSEAVQNHMPYNIEHRLLFADGRVKHVSERGETFYDTDGRPARSIGTVQDITARKQAEEERLRAKRLFHMIFNNVADGIVIHDATGSFMEVNRVFCERLGYEREELLQLSPADINDAEGAAKFAERGQQLTETGLITFETVHIGKNGRHIPVEVSASLIEYQGKPATLSVVRDISERKAAQEALRSSIETSRALLNATTESAILMDASGILLSINSVGAKRLRKSPEEIIGRNIYELMPANIAEGRKKVVDEVVRSGQPRQYQDECNGYHFAQSLYPIFDAQGKVSHIAIYAADITDRLKLQAEETLLNHIDQQVIRSDSLSSLLQFICNEIVLLFGYHFAWLGKKEASGELSVSAQSGSASAYLQDLQHIGVRWDDTLQGKGPAGTSIRSGQIQVFKISEKSFQPWHDAATRFGFKSIAGIPLIVRGEVYGALMLYSQLEHDFDDNATLKRLSGIASRICVALEMAMDQEQLRLLGAALASAGNGVFITDALGKIMWVNNAFTRLTGYSSEEAIGETPALLKSGKQNGTYYQMLWQTIQQGKTWSSETVERHKTGMLLTVQQTITPIKNEDGVISHYVSIIDDITSQTEIAARIQYMAHFDALTALPNRALFHDRLRQILAQAKRDGKTCALLFIDLDRFKAVNDTHGHHIGDLLLQGVAERLKDCVRVSDSISRLAGDEFTVLLPNVLGREDATLIAEKITASLASPFTLDGHEVNIGSSTGIAFFPADADSDEALIKCADQAMYAAKELGRGRFSFYRKP